MHPLVKTVCFADSNIYSYQIECAVLAVSHLFYHFVSSAFVSGNWICSETFNMHGQAKISVWRASRELDLLRRSFQHYVSRPTPSPPFSLHYESAEAPGLKSTTSGQGNFLQKPEILRMKISPQDVTSHGLSLVGEV